MHSGFSVGPSLSSCLRCVSLSFPAPPPSPRQVSGGPASQALGDAFRGSLCGTRWCLLITEVLTDFGLSFGLSWACGFTGDRREKFCVAVIGLWVLCPMCEAVPRSIHAIAQTHWRMSLVAQMRAVTFRDGRLSHFTHGPSSSDKGTAPNGTALGEFQSS